MKIFKMITGFFLKWRRSSKIMKNVIFHVKLYPLTLMRKYSFGSLGALWKVGLPLILLLSNL